MLKWTSWVFSTRRQRCTWVEQAEQYGQTFSLKYNFPVFSLISSRTSRIFFYSSSYNIAYTNNFSVFFVVFITFFAMLFLLLTCSMAAQNVGTFQLLSSTFGKFSEKCPNFIMPSGTTPMSPKRKIQVRLYNFFIASYISHTQTIFIPLCVLNLLNIIIY